MRLSPWLTAVFLPSLITGFDPSISNGTCYFGPNQQAASNFIPCGNAAGGVQSCCQARDICLSSNACFNGQFFVTYVAGCTDHDYNDAKCPSKGDFTSQQWVGLVRCHVSDGSGEEWGPCDEPDQPKVNKGNEKCTCTASSSTALFTDSAKLTDIASLPVSSGNAIAFFPGFEPSTTISDTIPTGAGATTTRADPPTATSTVAPDSSPPLSTGAKAGIGVGTAGGVLAISALLLWLLWYRRRSKKTVPPVKDQIRPSSIGQWSFNGGDDMSRAGSTANNDRAWRVKSELPTEANQITTTKTSLGENNIRTSFFATPATTYQAYQHSPVAEASEIDGSPAGSTSRLAGGSSTSEKPMYERPVYELPA